MSNLTEDAIQKIADLGEQAEKARVHTLDNGATFLTTPGIEQPHGINGPTKDDHDLLLAAPVRIKNNVTLQTADSLVDYIKTFKTGGTLLFANIATNSIRAVLDYHESPEKTAHAQHSATLSLPYSEEWKDWTKKHDQYDDQLAFARFLRENNADITTPDAATLIEIVKDIQAVRKVNFIKAVRLNSDMESFEYTDSTEAGSGKGGSLTIPEEFKINIPVYFNGAYVSLGAWLRWMLDGQNLKLGIHLHRHEHVRQAVFKEIVADIADRADVQAVYASFS